MTVLLVKSLKVRYSGDRMEEYVILVDQNDNPIGKEDKVKCHLPNGKLHRAFTALIFNGDGKLLLTKRGDGKMLWPNDWDGTVASHPRESETYVSSADELEQNKDVYCPWMVIALYFLADSNPNTLEKFNSLITKWASDDLKPVYENAIKHYIPDNNWRLVP